MIVGGVELISHRHHGGLWWFDARLDLAAIPAALPPHTVPASATAPLDSHTTFSREGQPGVGYEGRERRQWSRETATRITLGLWALYIPNLVISTGLRVMAWGTGTAGGGGASAYEHRLDRIGTPGHDESGYWIGAGHPAY